MSGHGDETIICGKRLGEQEGTWADLVPNSAVKALLSPHPDAEAPLERFGKFGNFRGDLGIFRKFLLL